MKRHFASDNNAGVHPEVLRAIAEANHDHAPAYGNDEWTARAAARVREILGSEAHVFFVLGGTGANVLILRHLTREHEGIVCAETAHICVDECGAVEAVGGRKLLPVATRDGKLTPDSLGRWLDDRGDVHRAQPRVVSISQATEYGTVYSLDELRRLCDTAHRYDMLVHIDGARLANAAVALRVSLREMTRDVGIDALTFGGTKNGLLAAEAVVFFDERHARDFAFTRKQMMQLASKGRFVAVQFEALLTNDLWRRSAEHANRMAALLANEIRDVDGVTITQPVQTNVVFASISPEAIETLQQSYRFLVWNAATSEVRWMTAFDTTEEDVRGFAGAIREAARMAGESR